jgi:glycogen operon protein
MATLLLSQGVPMILAGDEFLRTQKGNNNPWCQDNEVSWVDWSLKEKHAEYLRFVRELIGLRKRHPVFRRRRFFVGELGPVTARREPPPFPPAGPVRPGEAGLPTDATGRHPVPAADGSGVRTPPPSGGPPLADIHWHGTEPYQPDFGPTARFLAFSLDGRFTGRDGDPDYRQDNDFYVAMNVTAAALPFTVPPSPTGRRWRRLIDTAADPPADFLPENEGQVVRPREALAVAPFGLIVLISEP